MSEAKRISSVGTASDVFILVPEDERFASSWPVEFGRLRAALNMAGVQVRALAMTALPPPGSTVLPLLAWGYHLDPEAWLARLARLEAAEVRLINPAAALRWNIRKTYLIELYEAGLPVVPSIALDLLSPASLDDARRRFGVDTLVAKPQIGACAHGAMVMLPGTAPSAAGPLILQPFQTAIVREGELSLFFFGGRFSHAVRKRPKPGDFRVQAEHGGSVAPAEPPSEALAAARAVLAAAPADLCYARVDLVRDEAGHHRLMELELIEPQLFLHHAPDRGASLGLAVSSAQGCASITMEAAE